MYHKMFIIRFIVFNTFNAFFKSLCRKVVSSLGKTLDVLLMITFSLLDKKIVSNTFKNGMDHGQNTCNWCRPSFFFIIDEVMFI